MILNRYLFKSILYSCFLLYFIFACLLFIGQILEQSDKVNDTFNFAALIWYSVQLLPSQLIELSVIIISVGTLASLAIMSQHSELSVLQCSGQSTISLLHRAMLPALILLPIIWGTSEMNIAKVEQNAKAQKSSLISNKADEVSNLTTESDSELWFKHNDKYYYVSSVFSTGYAKKVKLWSPSQSHSKIESTESIASMSYEDYAADNRFWLQDFIKQTEFTDNSINTSESDFRTSHEMPSPTVLNSLSQDINKLPFQQLVNLYQQSHLHQLAFWNRLLLPFNIYSLILLSSAFVFGSNRQRDTGTKILIGSCVAIGGYMLQSLMPSVSIVFNLSPLFSLMLPIVLLTTLASYFIFKPT